MSEICEDVRKGRTADPNLFQSTVAASDLSQISHPVSLLSLRICKQSVHGYCLWKLSHNKFGKEVKIQSNCLILQ